MVKQPPSTNLAVAKQAVQPQAVEQFQVRSSVAVCHFEAHTRLRQQQQQPQAVGLAPVEEEVERQPEAEDPRQRPPCAIPITVLQPGGQTPPAMSEVSAKQHEMQAAEAHRRRAEEAWAAERRR